MRSVPCLLVIALAGWAPGSGHSSVADTAAAGVEPEQTPAVDAAPQPGKFDFHAGVGIKHDSNVAVLEIDDSSGEDDYALLIDLGLGYRHRFSEKASVRLDYAFSHTGYRDFDDYDLGIHRGSLDASYDLGIADAGIAAHYIDARLGGDAFMTMKQVSPYLSRLVGTRYFLRGAYLYTDKSFDDNPLRDAVNHGLSLDAFVFMNGVRTYISFGYRFNDENAEDAQFDYIGHQLSTQLTHKLAVGGRDLSLRARVRYENRSYDNPTPLIGETRDDDRYRADVSVAVPLSDKLTATAAWEYADNRSNLPSVDFSERTLSVRVDARL